VPKESGDKTREGVATEGSYFYKARMQKLDQKGQIVVCKQLRDHCKIPPGTFVYLKPLGEGKILLQALCGNEDFFEMMEKGLKAKEDELKVDSKEQ
jgi:bifunctional DNA-binding transcriptional regulator/antitoxin component of YhaV-PrlF toxin-antitoxin module